jgi:hypothetical protein
VPDWLLVSIVASIVLTVVLNVALRLLPGAGRGLDDVVTRMTERSDAHTEVPDETRVRMVVPWKFMLVASLVLTVVLNVILRLL